MHNKMFIIAICVCIVLTGCEHVGEVLMGESRGREMTESYLSLHSDSEDAITPINDSSEWGSWEQNSGTWEMMKGEEFPFPVSPFPPPTPLIPKSRIRSFVKSYSGFEYWFYSYADSKIVFDLKGRNYRYFDCFLYTPGCPDRRNALKMVWYADDVEVWNSGNIGKFGDNLTGVLNTNLIRVSFDVPPDTDTLTLEMTDVISETLDHELGQGCNHFVIGNSQFFAENPYENLLHLHPLVPELEPGTYRMHVNSVAVGDGDDSGIVFYDEEQPEGRVYFVGPASRFTSEHFTAENEFVLIDVHVTIRSDEYQYYHSEDIEFGDEIVVKILGKHKKPYKYEQDGITYTIYEYPGEIIRNLDKPARYIGPYPR